MGDTQGQGTAHICSKKLQPECIPVGCVPAARWPYAAVCFPGGCAWSGRVSALGGVPGPGGRWLVQGVCSRGLCSWGGLLPGGCAWSKGVCAWSGGMCLVQGGVCSWGVCVYPSMHWGRHAPLLWTEFLTHACEKITLAQLRCSR